MTAEVNVLIALGLLTIAAGLAIGGWMLVRAAPVGGRDRISYRSAKRALETMAGLGAIGLFLYFLGTR